MIPKSPVCPDRVRVIPKQFSWVDQRLVRDRHIDRLSHASAALYLFLVTVADARGLSYYGDVTIQDRLGMEAPVLEQARRDLVRAGLVAYEKPIYQVLPLDPCPPPASRRPAGEPQSLSQILKHMMEHAP